MRRSRRLQLLPDDVVIPGMRVTDRVYLRPLRTDDVQLDYAAVMESAGRLRRWGGGPWPEPDFTLAGNLADLDRHQREHESREAFTYTVMNLDQSLCLGCVYLEPVSRWSRHAERRKRSTLAAPAAPSAVVRFWVRTSTLAERLDVHLFDTLREWLKQEWPFTMVYYLTNERLESQLDLFRSAGLRRAFSVRIAEKQGKFQAYARPGDSPASSAVERPSH